MSHRPAEQRWNTAIGQGSFGVWDLNPVIETVHYSPGWKTRLGFPCIDAPDRTWFWRCRVHPNDFDAMARSLRAHLEGDAGTYEARFRLRVNGSGYRTVLSRGRVVARDPRGTATRMVGTMIDLTGRPGAAVAGHGLAAEGLAPALAASAPPFHALLGARQETPASVGRPDAEQREGERLIELVSDLLEMALAAAPAQPNGHAR